MKPAIRLVVASGCVLAAWLPMRAVAAPAFHLEDMRRIVSLSEPQISPDGKYIAVIVSTPDWKSNEDRLEIDLIDVATGVRRTLTHNREDLSMPRWSPDGTRLAFIAKDTTTADDADAASDASDATDADSDESQDQVFILPMNGGDALRLTNASHGIVGYGWSPDGKQIAFVTPDDAINAKAIKNHDDAFQVTDNNFLVRAALSPSHLWVVASDGGKPKRLTHGSFSLQTDQQDNGPTLTWSADGRSIAFAKFPNAYWGPSFQSVIATVDVNGGEPRTLVANEGSANAMYAPGGNTLAFMRPRGGDQNNGNAVYVQSDGKARDTTAALARNFNQYAWLPHGNGLLLAGEDGAHSVLWRQPLAGAAQKLDLGAVEASGDLSVSKNGMIAFIGSTPTHANELYVLDSIAAKPRALTQINGFLGGLALGRTESIEWQGPDGFREDGVLTYPVGFEKGKTYPLVLVLHGGPEGASTVAFAPLTQLLSAAGFIVFSPNYRGSINLGDAYQHAIYRDTGEGPGKDVMAGVEAVQKLGIVDPQRIGVSGWSYGGYMTTWLTGHYPIWKAAVAGAALTDWVMDYTVSYYQTGDLYFFGGSPWKAKDFDIWRAQSPIASASKVTAPTLIMGDVGDPNVPLINSYEWYHALRDNGVPVEFYAYPVDTHSPHDIVRKTDVYRRWVEWMTKHLK